MFVTTIIPIGNFDVSKQFVTKLATSHYTGVIYTS